MNLNPFNRRKESPVAGITLAYHGGRAQRSVVDIDGFSKEAYQGNPDVYTAIEILAKSAAGVEWYCEKRVRGSWERLDSHEMLDLWMRPNPRQANTGLVGDLIRWRCIAGEWFLARNEKPSGKPRELWVLNPGRMEVIPGRSPLEMIARYDYKMGGQTQPLDPANVCHLPTFNPTNEFRGQSPLLAAARLVDQATAAAEYNLGLLQNGGIPPGFLKHDDELSDEQFEKFKKEMREVWGVSKNAGLPQLLEGGMTYQAVGTPPKDMQMLEAQRMFALKFAQVIGVPAEFLSGAGEKKYANYGEARKALYTEAVLPTLDDLADAVNAWLAPMFGGDVRLCYDRDDIEALQEDVNEKWARVAAADHLTIDEKRAETGQEPLPGGIGDVLLVPFSLTPLAQLGAEVAEAVEEAVPVEGEGLKSKALDMPDDAKAAYWKRIDQQRARVLGRAEKMAAARLTDEHAAVVKAIQGAPTAPALEARAGKAIDAGRKEWAAFYEKAALAIAEPFAEQTTRELTGSEKAKAAKGWQAFVLQYVKRATAAKVTAVTDTAKKEIAAVVARGVAEGLAVPDIAKLVQQTGVEQIIPKRAEVIARTEVVQASNAGSVGAAKATGLSLVKEWIPTADDRTREGHADVASVGLDDSFDVDGESLEFPGDGSQGASADNIIQCRCTVGYVSA